MSISPKSMAVAVIWPRKSGPGSWTWPSVQSRFSTRKAIWASRRFCRGRNVIACRSAHPLLQAAQFRPANVLNYSWIEPPPGSPLSADLQTTLIGLGAERVRISYSGASLAGILEHLRTSNSLAVLPFGVVHAQRRFGEIAELPLTLTHPPRSLGVLQSGTLPPSPAALQLKMHILGEFSILRSRMETGD